MERDVADAIAPPIPSRRSTASPLASTASAIFSARFFAVIRRMNAGGLPAVRGRNVHSRSSSSSLALACAAIARFLRSCHSKPRS